MVREVLLIFSASETVRHRSKTGSGSAMGWKSLIGLFFMAFLLFIGMASADVLPILRGVRKGERSCLKVS
jgi:hypothetical protein